MSHTILYDSALSALREVVEFERNNGKMATVFEWGGPFNTKRIHLNDNFESIIGPVDADWMMTVAPWGLSARLLPENTGALSAVRAFAEDVRLKAAAVQVGSVYLAGKILWNTARWGYSHAVDAEHKYELEYSSVIEAGNLNSPKAAALWLNTSKSLADIFAPALARRT